jgi:hypothetical protein
LSPVGSRCCSLRTDRLVLYATRLA